MYLFLRLCKLQWGRETLGLKYQWPEGIRVRSKRRAKAGRQMRVMLKRDGCWKAKGMGRWTEAWVWAPQGQFFWPAATTKDMEKWFLHVGEEMVEALAYWERGSDELNSIDALAFFLDSLPAVSSKELEPKQTVAILLKVTEGLEFGMIPVAKTF